MVYVVSRNRETKEVEIFDCQNKPEAKEVIEANWDTYVPVAIFQGTQLNFTISYADEEEIIIKKKPKVSID